MKKNFIKGFTIGFVLLFLIGLVAYFMIESARRNKFYQMITIPSSHLVILQADKTIFKLEAFIDDSYFPYFNDDFIFRLTLKDLKTKDEYALALSSITKEHCAMMYQEKAYYQYVFTLVLPFDSESDIILDEAILNIMLNNGDEIELMIGNIAFVKDFDRKAFLIDELKALMIGSDQESKLGGVFLKLSSLEDEVIKIKNIEVLNANLSINYDYLCFVEMSEGRNLKDYLAGYSEKMISVNQAWTKDFAPLETTSLIIPFQILNDDLVEMISIRINYEYYGREYVQLIEPRILLQNYEGKSNGVRIIYEPH